MYGDEISDFLVFIYIFKNKYRHTQFSHREYMVCLCNAIKMLVVYDSAAFKIFFNFLYCQKALHVKKNVIPIQKN